MPGPSNKSRTKAWLLLLLLAATVACAGEDLRADLPKALRVGFAAWGGSELEARDEYLRFSLPLQLRDRLGAVRARELVPEEREALAGALARRRAETLRAQLREVNRARDEVLFKRLPRSERARALVPLEARGSELLDGLMRVERDLPHRELLATAIPLAYEPVELIEAPRTSVGVAARKAGVDLVVWGRLEPLQGYLYWRVGCYSVLLDRDLFAAERVSAPEGVAAAVAEAVGGLAEALLGRPWSALTVVSLQPGARVRVDGRAEGIGPVELPFLVPGPHVVEVALPGYETRRSTVFLEPRLAQRLDVALTPLETRAVTLASTPGGALVYQDSLYVGATPLELTLPPEGVVTYRLFSEGYFDQYQPVDAAGPQRVEASLRRRLADPTEWQEIRRKRFYRSLGALALSVPIPIVSYAFALDSAVARANTFPGTSEFDTLTTRATIGYALYLGGMFASVVLGVNMVRDLREYVRYADDPAF